MYYIVSFSILSFAILKYFSSFSIPIYCLFVCMQAIHVLPLPIQLSKTISFSFVYEKEDIKVAEMRENSIKEYLEKEKSISSKQIIFSKETKSTSSNFDV